MIFLDWPFNTVIDSWVDLHTVHFSRVNTEYDSSVDLNSVCAIPQSITVQFVFTYIYIHTWINPPNFTLGLLSTNHMTTVKFRQLSTIAYPAIRPPPPSSTPPPTSSKIKSLNFVVKGYYCSVHLGITVISFRRDVHIST